MVASHLLHCMTDCNELTKFKPYSLYRVMSGQKVIVCLQSYSTSATFLMLTDEDDMLYQNENWYYGKWYIAHV